MYSVETDPLRLPSSSACSVNNPSDYSSTSYDMHSTLTSTASILNNHCSDYHHSAIGGTPPEFHPVAESTPQHPGYGGNSDHQPTSSFDHSLVEYKSEPPPTPTYSHTEQMISVYPTSFTPSPSSHGSTADSPPPSLANLHHMSSPPSVSSHDLPPHPSSSSSPYANFFNLQSVGSGHSGPLEGPYHPAPTPPLSASHHTKEHSVDMVLSSDTNILLEQSAAASGGAPYPWSEEQKECICDNLTNNNEFDKLGKKYLKCIFFKSNIFYFFMFIRNVWE